MTRDDILSALANLDQAWQLCSLLVDYPRLDELSIFYLNDTSQFIHRVVHLPEGKTVDNPIAPKPGFKRS